MVKQVVEAAWHALYTKSPKKIRCLAVCHEDQFSLLVCVHMSICQSSVGFSEHRPRKPKVWKFAVIIS